jgi:hypothetical protein
VLSLGNSYCSWIVVRLGSNHKDHSGILKKQ